MANFHETAEALARWRDAERRLDDVPPETAEAEELQAEAAAMRDQYKRLTEAPAAIDSVTQGGPANAEAMA